MLHAPCSSAVPRTVVKRATKTLHHAEGVRKHPDTSDLSDTQGDPCFRTPSVQVLQVPCGRVGVWLMADIMTAAIPNRAVKPCCL